MAAKSTKYNSQNLVSKDSDNRQKYLNLCACYYKFMIDRANEIVIDGYNPRDLVHETIISISTHKRSGEMLLELHNNAGNIEGYLTKSLKNRFLNIRRHLATIKPRVQDIKNILIKESDPSYYISDWDEYVKELEESIENVLPPKTFEVFLMRYFEGLSLQEIAEWLNIVKIDTVDKRLDRGRKKLRECLKFQEKIKTLKGKY